MRAFCSAYFLAILLAAPLAQALELSGRVLPLRSNAVARSSPLYCGLFDFKESAEAKRKKDEAWEAQQEILRRRRNPELMEQYEQDVAERRSDTAASDKDLKEMQLSRDDGKDKLEAWQRLRDEGKVKIMDETERDKGSERMGSAGLIGERMDAQLPYIDAGYVDESADVMGAFRKLFGGGGQRGGKGGE